MGMDKELAGAIKQLVRESVKEVLDEQKKEDQKKMTKEQIMSVKDRNERQKLISENIDLFK